MAAVNLNWRLTLKDHKGLSLGSISGGGRAAEHIGNARASHLVALGWILGISKFFPRNTSRETGKFNVAELIDHSALLRERTVPSLI